MSYSIAPRIRDIANELIDKNHEHLQDAKDLIEYYVRDDSADWYGKCHKCTGFERFLTGKIFHIFILDVPMNAWPMEKLRALVDHELCHIGRKKEDEPWYDSETGTWKPPVYLPKNEPESWFLIDHDIEEFSKIVDRHGLWETGVEKFAQSVRTADYQITLGDIEPVPERTLKVVKQ